MAKHDIGDNVLVNLEITERVEKKNGIFYKVGVIGPEYLCIDILVREKDISENITKKLDGMEKAQDCKHKDTTKIDDRKFCVDCGKQLENKEDKRIYCARN